MTEQEQIQEEIRLLNLRVDELKAQNGHYKVDAKGYTVWAFRRSLYHLSKNDLRNSFCTYQ
jgi:hypothetical protein